MKFLISKKEGLLNQKPVKIKTKHFKERLGGAFAPREKRIL
jgi:hypothetical protein